MGPLSVVMQSAPVNVEHVLAYALAPTITSLGALGVAWMNKRSNNRSERKLHAIDNAVNGRPPGSQTVSENVQELIDRPEVG